MREVFKQMESLPTFPLLASEESVMGRFPGTSHEPEHTTFQQLYGVYGSVFVSVDWPQLLHPEIIKLSKAGGCEVLNLECFQYSLKHLKQCSCCFVERAWDLQLSGSRREGTGVWILPQPLSRQRPLSAVEYSHYGCLQLLYSPWEGWVKSCRAVLKLPHTHIAVVPKYNLLQEP